MIYTHVANPSWDSDTDNDNLRVQRMGLEGMKLDQGGKSPEWEVYQQITNLEEKAFYRVLRGGENMGRRGQQKTDTMATSAFGLPSLISLEIVWLRKNKTWEVGKLRVYLLTPKQLAVSVMTLGGKKPWG